MTFRNFSGNMYISNKNERKENMSRLHELLDTVDSVAGVETKIGYADTLIWDLLLDYDGIDLEKMREKVSVELPRIMTFLNIVNDYILDSKEKLNEIIKELNRICDEVKKEENFPGIVNRDKVA